MSTARTAGWWRCDHSSDDPHARRGYSCTDMLAQGSHSACWSQVDSNAGPSLSDEQPGDATAPAQVKPTPYERQPEDGGTADGSSADGGQRRQPQAGSEVVAEPRANASSEAREDAADDAADDATAVPASAQAAPLPLQESQPHPRRSPSPVPRLKLQEDADAKQLEATSTLLVSRIWIDSMPKDVSLSTSHCECV